MQRSPGHYGKEVPLETTDRHCLSLQESPFGNEATKDSSTSALLLLEEVTLMSNSLFTFPVVLFIAVGGGVRVGVGGGRRRLIEMYLLII